MSERDPSRNYPIKANLEHQRSFSKFSSIKKLIQVAELKQGDKKTALILLKIGLNSESECYHQLRRSKPLFIWLMSYWLYWFKRRALPVFAFEIIRRRLNDQPELNRESASQNECLEIKIEMSLESGHSEWLTVSALSMKRSQKWSDNS